MSSSHVCAFVPVYMQLEMQGICLAYFSGLLIQG